MVTLKSIDETPASITFHFDGPIVDNHRITARTLGKTLDHMQNAIDRSYLDVTHGNVLKYQRLKNYEYAATDFLVLPPRDGGFILEMVSSKGKQIADRLFAAVATAYEQDVSDGATEHQRIMEQAAIRRSMFKKTGEATPYEDFLSKAEEQLAPAFADRSIVKEIDQVLSLIRTERHSGSTFDLTVYGSKPHGVLEFDSVSAARFHKVVSERRLGDPIILNMELRSMDAGRANQLAHGKATNAATGKEFNFLVPSTVEFDRMARYLKRQKRLPLKVVACPIFEYEAFDPYCGDMVVISFLGAIDG